MYKMQCRDMDVFRNFFIFGAPKFVSPCPPPLNGEIADYHKEPIDHQTEVRWIDIVNFASEKRNETEIQIFVAGIPRWSATANRTTNHSIVSETLHHAAIGEIGRIYEARFERGRWSICGQFIDQFAVLQT